MTIQNPLDAAMKRTDGKTLIINNGSTYAGQHPAQIDKLFERLENNTLDPSFYHMSLFQAHPWEPVLPLCPAKEQWRGAAHFWGNFMDYSHVYSIITRDEALITRLQQAIDRNIRSEAFVEEAISRYTGYMVMSQPGDGGFLLPPGEAELAELNQLKGCRAYRNGSKIIGLWSEDYLTKLTKVA